MTSSLHFRNFCPLKPCFRRRTRHLGALDDWGLGILEALDDGSGRGSYEVTATHVTVAAW